MSFSVPSSYAKIRTILDTTPNYALPSSAALLKATNSLPTSLPTEGLGDAATEAHLLSDIVPGFNGNKTSSNYYGFVTGGVLPIAEVADNIVTAFDQNVQVHLPDQSISTIVEDKALSMLVELLNLGPGWNGKTFTTGATTANILGLACGREAVISARLKAAGIAEGVGELGLLAACMKAGVTEVQILTTMGHSSLYKAASVVGLGRTSIKDISASAEEPWRLCLKTLEHELERSNDGVLSIVAISAGEVNTGMFAVSGLDEMQKVRKLCDKYGAWVHVDAAFGLFARSLPDTDEFSALHSTAAGIELADSITSDCHKMLNVNPNAAYLASGPSSIPSPLNIGLENSRRFRALPVYAVLLSTGKTELALMFARQVRLARGISLYLKSSKGYEVLAHGLDSNTELAIEHTHVIVLFRAKDDAINVELVKRINATRKIYVSGTQWEGKPACRFAISTWKVDVNRDLALIKEVLESVLKN